MNQYPRVEIDYYVSVLIYLSSLLQIMNTT